MINMRTITIFYDNSGYTLRWLRALILAKKEFKERGYRIKFDTISAPLPSFQKLCPPPTTVSGYKKLFSKKEYDIVFLAYHHSQNYGMCKLTTEDRAEVLKYLKSKTTLLCWMDSSDSTGTCMFDVLPYVDLYFKKQILVNKEAYYKKMYGGRIWCDYYHKKLGIQDSELEKLSYETLDKAYEHKIKLSWNVGLGDLFTKSKFKKIIYRNKYAPFVFTEPSINRKYDLHYRGSTSSSLALFQRNETIKLLKLFDKMALPDTSKKVPYKEYVREVQNSRVIISPFGWGEICGRDFEAFMHGCTLIKMDMDHMITYPDIYIKNKTYLPIDWDFNNFNDTMEYIMTDDGKKKCFEIAKYGQDIYMSYLTSHEKKLEFADHIISQFGGEKNDKI